MDGRSHFGLMLSDLFHDSGLFQSVAGVDRSGKHVHGIQNVIVKLHGVFMFFVCLKLSPVSKSIRFLSSKYAAIER
jgi:hypothetical protein